MSSLDEEFQRQRLEEKLDADAGKTAHVRTPPKIAEGLIPRDEALGIPLSDPEFDMWCKWVVEAKEKGWAEGGLLHEWLMARITTLRVGHLEAENPRSQIRADDLRAAKKEAFDRIHKAEKQLEEEAARKGQAADAITMLDQYRAKATQYVKDHAGEFSFMACIQCHKCGEEVKGVVDTDGLPHWACVWEKDGDGEIVFLKWAPEVLYLYNKGLIPLHVAAFILRTSIKGLIYTARRREEKIRSCNELAEEDALKTLHVETDWPRIRRGQL